jgi:hypothetical protein
MGGDLRKSTRLCCDDDPSSSRSAYDTGRVLWHSLSGQSGSVLDYLGFAAAMVTLGYGLSAVTRDSLMAAETCAALTLPNFLLSGLTWPVFAMPKVMRPLAFGLPMNCVGFIIKKITVMGGPLTDCGSQIVVLGAWSVAPVCAWRGIGQVLNAARGGTPSNA